MRNVAVPVRGRLARARDSTFRWKVVRGVKIFYKLSDMLIILTGAI